MAITQETVRKHFENAKTVKRLSDGVEIEIKHPIKIHKTVPGVFCVESTNNELACVFSNNEYAFIVAELDELNQKEETIVLNKEKLFEENVDKTLAEIKELLLVKGKEYRRNNNPYHNFERGAAMSGEIPEKVLYGFQLKHEVSMSDIRDDIEKGILPTEKMVVEKWNDALVYTLIEKCMILNRIK